MENKSKYDTDQYFQRGRGKRRDKASILELDDLVSRPVYTNALQTLM